MDILTVVLRLVHIIGGVVWVGGAFANTLFIEPAIASAGEDGHSFSAQFFGNGKFANAMSVAAMATIFAGVILYWRASGGLSLDWLRSGQGIMFTVGGVAGLIASGIGMLVIGRTGDQLGEVQQVIAMSTQAPSAQLIALSEALQRKITIASRVDLVFMLIAVIGMATARYATFSL